MVVRADVFDANDRDDLFELLADLLEYVVIAYDDERHSRESRIFGFADGEAIDVVAARGEHAGHMGEHAGDVLHGGGEDVAHLEGGWRGRDTGAASAAVERQMPPKPLSGRFLGNLDNICRGTRKQPA